MNIYILSLFSYVISLTFLADLAVQQEDINGRNFRFVFSAVNYGDCAPSTLVNSIDILKETWEDDFEGGLTALGARKQYFLGLRNRDIYKIKNQFLSDKILYQELFIQSMNNTCALESAHAHLQGLYPAGSESILPDEKIAKADPPYISHFDGKPIVEEIKAELGKFAISGNSNSYVIHSLQNNDNIVGLESQEKCKGIENYIKRYIDQSEINSAFDNFKSQFGDKLTKAGVIQNNQKLDLELALQISETFIKGKANAKLFKSLVDINLIEFEKSCNNLFFTWQSYHKYNDSVKHISKVASTNFVKKIHKWMTDRVVKDKTDLSGLSNLKGNTEAEVGNYIPYESPKYVLFMLNMESFTSLTHFIKYVFSIQDRDIDPKNVFANSFNFELMINSNPSNPVVDKDFTVRLLFNDRIIYDDSYTNFISKFQNYFATQDEIVDFCELNPSEDDVWIIVIISLSVILVAQILFLLCLKLRRDRYLGLLEDMKKASEQEDENSAEQEKVRTSGKNQVNDIRESGVSEATKANKIEEESKETE